MFLTAHRHLVRAPGDPSRNEDPFSLYAKELINELLAWAFEHWKNPRIAIVFANCFGGWTFGEPQLKRLAASGRKRLSPHQAVAWFPAAAQGRVTIEYQLKCPAMTFSSEYFAFYDALQLARWWLKTGACEAVLAGAAESFGSAFLARSVHAGASCAISTDSCVWWVLASEGVHEVQTIDSGVAGVESALEESEYCAEVPLRGATALPLTALAALEEPPVRYRVPGKYVVQASDGVLAIHRLDRVSPEHGKFDAVARAT